MSKLDNQEIIDVDKFLAISNKYELAEILNIKFKNLIYNLYVLPDSNKYKYFEIPKRGGGTRTITAPISRLKYIQKKLSVLFLKIYKPKPCVHSYIENKGILSNSKNHVNKKFIINLDLSDFFPSINFGRVRGIFKSHPFNFNDEIATILAQICSIDNMLPQGASTSPIISNFICRNLDYDLMTFAKKTRCTYTRYADDITLSTNISPLPKQIGKIENNQLILSSELKNIIVKNGFQINFTKLHFSTRKNRQEVTGIIVNEFPNINRKYLNNIRAMLNAWEKYCLEKAAEEHFKKYNIKQNTPKDKEIYFEKMLVGKIGFIGMVRGKGDNIYGKLYTRIKILYPEANLSIIVKGENLIDKPTIYGRENGLETSKSSIEQIKSCASV